VILSHFYIDQWILSLPSKIFLAVSESIKKSFSMSISFKSFVVENTFLSLPKKSFLLYQFVILSKISSFSVSAGDFDSKTIMQNIQSKS